MAKRSIGEINTQDDGEKRAKQSKKGAWSENEDKLLKAAVDKNGLLDWAVIAEHVPGRTKKQCRDRYKLKLDPSINHQPFTEEEDNQLTKLQGEFGNQWTKIAKYMPGRTENSVKSRFASLLRSRTREWTPEEDMILRSQRALGVDFSVISEKHLTKRSEHAVRKRWERLFIGDLASKIRSENPSSPPSAASPPPALLEVPSQAGISSKGYDGSMAAMSRNSQFLPPQGPPLPLSNPRLLPEHGTGPQQASQVNNKLSSLIDSMLGGASTSRPLVNPVLLEDRPGFLEAPNGGVPKIGRAHV